EAVTLRMRVTSELVGDPRRIGVEVRLRVDARDRRLTSDVPVTDEVAEHAGMVRGNWLGVPERPGPTHTCQAVARGEAARLEPSGLGEDPVVGRHGQLRAVLEEHTDDLLLPLVHTCRDGTDLHLAALVHGPDVRTSLVVDDVLDVVSTTG